MEANSLFIGILKLSSSFTEAVDGCDTIDSKGLSLKFVGETGGGNATNR
jgi:hypothetical protein